MTTSHYKLNTHRNTWELFRARKLRLLNSHWAMSIESNLQCIPLCSYTFCQLFNLNQGLSSNNQENPRVRNFFFWPAMLGPELAAPIYGRLEQWRSFCRKTAMPIKFLVLGGGVVFCFFF